MSPHARNHFSNGIGWFTGSNAFLTSANEVCEGYVFTLVCHSVHRGVSRSIPEGRLRGLVGGRSPGPYQGGRLRVLAGGSPGSGLGGPDPGRGGVYPSMHWGRHPSPQQTAADGTHPTGMHSCLILCTIVVWSKTGRQLLATTTFVGGLTYDV